MNTEINALYSLQKAIKTLFMPRHKLVITFLRDNGTATVKEIESGLNRNRTERNRFEQSVVSQLLADLRKHNLVTFVRDGKHKYYTINQTTVDYLTKLGDGYQDFLTETAKAQQ